MEGRHFVSSLFMEVAIGNTNAILDTGTVDYDSTLQARHLFRLAAMTEVPIPAEGSEARKQ
jgi:sulfonate dioxygenase